MIARFLRRLFARFARRKNETNAAVRFEAVRTFPVRASEVATPDFELLPFEDTLTGLAAKVILYNDDVHTFDEVIVQLIKATGCTWHEATRMAFEVDTRGLACVFEGELDSCLSVSSVLEEIALHTTVEM